MGNRQHKLSINLKDDEFQELQRAAEAANLPIATYIRTVVIDAVRAPKTSPAAPHGDNFTYLGRPNFVDPDGDIEDLKRRVASLEREVTQLKSGGE